MNWLLYPLAITFLLVAPALLLGQTEHTDTKFRTWETSSGRKSDDKLRLILSTEDTVRLERKDGKTVTLKLSQLSRRDQKYIARQVELVNQPAEETPPKTSIAAASWPQWRGPNRDGKSPESGLLERWEGTPKLVWNTPGLGEGYSTPAATADAIYVLGTEGNNELIFCLDWDGNIRWKSRIGSKTNGGGYPGPRGTPSVHNGVAYAVTSDGTISAVEVQTGKVLWQRRMKQDFGGECGHWGFAESPLVDGEQVICTPGGPNAAVVALRTSDGQPVWRGKVAGLNQTRSGYTTAGYASPIVADIQGLRQYIVFLQGGLVSFAARTGEPLWHYEAPANDTANCSTPVAVANSVFAASGYGTGGGKVDVLRQGGSWTIREQFFSRQMVNHHGGFVVHEGHIYGTNEQALLCLNWKTGQVKWKNRSVGKGSVSFADGKLYVRGEKGAVALVAASPDSYRELGRFDQPFRSGREAWPHPVIARKKLILRDGDRILCFDIGA